MKSNRLIGSTKYVKVHLRHYSGQHAYSCLLIVNIKRVTLQFAVRESNIVSPRELTRVDQSVKVVTEKQSGKSKLAVSKAVYDNRCFKGKTTSVATAEFYGVFILSNIRLPVNLAVVNS